MIKAIFIVLTGIDESIDSPEAQEAWEKQRVIDELDIQAEDESDDEDKDNA